MQMQPETANEILEASQDGQMAKNDGLADFPNKNMQSTNDKFKKELSLNSKDMANTPMVTNTLEINSKKTASPSTKAKLKSNAPLIEGAPSLKESPQRKRKRYLSNPAVETTALSSTPVSQNGPDIPTRSPSTTVKRRRRRSASLSIDNSTNSPKENKNDENLPVHIKTSVQIKFDKHKPSPQKSFRTPPKRLRANSGSENDAKVTQVSSRECVTSPYYSSSYKGPPSTTIWRWSPIRGKFKPKSVEYQNGIIVEHPEEDDALLAASFKSKWQSVS